MKQDPGIFAVRQFKAGGIHEILIGGMLLLATFMRTSVLVVAYVITGKITVEIFKSWVASADGHKGLFPGERLHVTINEHLFKVFSAFPNFFLISRCLIKSGSRGFIRGPF
jgi:hypothetical protein